MGGPRGTPVVQRARNPNRGALRAAALLVLLLPTAVACGYRLMRSGFAPGADVRSLAVVALRNDSYEPGVDALLTAALRREALRRGGVRLVGDPEQADLIISGVVQPLDVHVTTTSSVAVALEHRILLSVELRATRTAGLESPLESLLLSEQERYLSSADVEAVAKNREEALRRIAAVLATRFWDILTARLRS